MTRCAVYVRLSHDRPDETSTERQEADCRKLAEAKSWEVVAVYKDLQSAWSDRERPDFERMLRDAKSGAFDVLLVWKFDRLARSVLTFERAVRGLTGCGIEFASLSESVDTTTPMGKFTLHLTGALAQLESDTISYRVRAANRHLASTGLAATGGRRCFGYNRDGSLNEDEAELLREAARRFLDGATLTAVVKGWNAEGIRTGSGNEWGPSVLGRLLRAERIAGMRRHRDQVFAGDWEPIIDRPTFYALAEALGDSKRRTVRRGIKRHLLTGIARCSLCGQGMGTRIPKPGGGVRYACVNAPGRKGCGRVTILAGPLEAIVERIVDQSSLLALHGSPVAPAITAADVSKLQVERADDQASLEGLARDHYCDHLISRAEFLAARAPLQERIAAAERLIDQATAPCPEASGSTRASQDNIVISIEDRRSLITACLDKVVIRPAARPGTRRFDPTRISIVTRSGDVLAVVQATNVQIDLQDGDGRVRLTL